MNLYFIFTFICLATNCGTFKIGQDLIEQEDPFLLQMQSVGDDTVDNRHSQGNVKDQMPQVLGHEWTNNWELPRMSRVRRQDNEDGQPSVTTTTQISTDSANVAATSPAPLSDSPTEGGQQYYTVNIPIPSFGNGGSEGFKQTLGNVNNAVQDLGSKLISTVSDLVSSVGQMVSGLVSGKSQP